MFTPEQLLEIAQTIQPKIRDLLSPEEADRIEPELTHLIQQLQNGQPVAKQLLLLLNSQTALQSYLTQINRGATPPGNSPPIPASGEVPFRGMPNPTPDPPKTDHPNQK
jgi:hypothetical protein